MGRQKPYWYYQLKFSWPGRIFTRLLHPGIKKEFEQARKYYCGVLPGDGGLVFDIGANVGDLSAVFLSMGFKVVACEPDPLNFTILKARFGRQRNIILLQNAVTQNAGKSILFQSAAHGGSLSTLSEKRKRQLNGIADEEGVISFENEIQVDTISLDEMIGRFGRPGFIKIDVEGFEKLVLSGISEPVPLISFEANLPEFKEETLQCIFLLQSLDSMGTFNASADDTGLLFEQFQSGNNFINWFQKQEYTYLEIFCRQQKKSDQ